MLMLLIELSPISLQFASQGVQTQMHVGVTQHASKSKLTDLRVPS